MSDKRLEIEKPDDIDITVRRDAGLELTLTMEAPLTGSTMILSIRDKDTHHGTSVIPAVEVTSFTTVNVTDDTVTFIVPPAVMSGLVAAEYYYAIQQQISTTTLNVLATGKLLIKPHPGKEFSS